MNGRISRKERAMADALSKSEVDALFAAIDVSITPQNREEHARWLAEVKLTDDQTLAIKFLTEIVGWELVRCTRSVDEDDDEEEETLYYGIFSGARITIRQKKLFEPSKVARMVRKADSRHKGLRGRLQRNSCRTIADALDEIIGLIPMDTTPDETARRLIVMLLKVCPLTDKRIARILGD